MRVQFPSVGGVSSVQIPGLWDQRVDAYVVLLDTSRVPSTWVYYFAFPPAVIRGPVSPQSCQ